MYIDMKGGNERQLIRGLFEQSEPPTAVFSTSLLINVEVLAALTECKLRVPDDISVVGYDDAT